MKKLLGVLLLATSGCYYQGYAVKKVVTIEPPVSREEAERLSRAGVSEPVLIELVEKRGAAPLTSDDLVALKNAGTPDSVVQKMIAAERKAPETVVVDGEYAYPGYYYTDYPYYYSSFAFGYGVSFGYHRYYYPRYYWGGVRVYR